jgi:aspartyl-tRNA(Asn)/glutamyl-tRNA(Gln) amidotransferase subunit A
MSQSPASIPAVAPMPSSDLHYATIEQLAPALQRQELSPVELIETVLERVERLDRRLGVFITVMGDQARTEARKADESIRRGEYRGPLHGIPVSLKDLYNTAGVRTTCGSKILADFVPREDATSVARLRQAGAIIIGKNNLHEFAFGPTGINPHYGTTRNPWDEERVPGGSSGGSGVAVAVGMGCASLGSDTGGSIRIPASLCGTVGLKPTYGRVSRYGVFPLSWSADHVGPLTRSVRDAAHVLDAIAGHDPRDPASSRRPVPELATRLSGQVRTLRAGVLQETLGGVDVDVLELFDAAVEQLRELGLSVDEVSVPEARHASGSSTATLFAEAGAIHQRWLRERPQDYGADTRNRFELGAMMPAVHYIKGQQARSAIIAAFEPVWKAFDVLLMPTTPLTAPPISQNFDNAIRYRLTDNTRLFNVLGTPACSVPCGFTGAGLPVGLSVGGRAFDEARVLDVALAYEEACDWKERRPPVD